MSRATPRSPAPFAAFEWMIAWRYLRAKRAEGPVFRQRRFTPDLPGAPLRRVGVLVERI